MGYSKPKPQKNNAKYNAMVLATRAERKGQPGPLEGRKPTVFVTQQVIDDLCLHIAEFGEPMEVACTRQGISSSWAIRKYCKEHPDAAEQLEEARKRGVHTIAFACRDIARGKGESSKDVVRDKLIIDTDMKILRAIAPREYGDKQTVEVEHSGNITHSLEERKQAAIIEAEAIMLKLVNAGSNEYVTE